LTSKFGLITVFLIVLALGLRFHQEYVNANLISDDTTYLETLKRNRQDLGLSQCSYTIENNRLVKNCAMLSQWPSGYSLFLTPLYFVTNNLFFTELLSQFLGILLIFIGMYKTLNLFDISRKNQWLFTLFFGLCSAPFYYSGTTDNLVAGLYLLSFYLMLKIAVYKNFKLINFLSVGGLLLTCGLIRYAALPNFLIAIVFFFILFLVFRDKKILIGTAGLFLLVATFYYLFFKYFAIDPGRVSFIDKLMTFDFYWNHLKWFDPFPLKAFFYLDPIAYRLENTFFVSIYRWFGLLFSIGIMIIIGSYFFKNSILSSKWRSNFNNKYFLFFTLGILTFGLIMGVMIIQSLTIPPENEAFGPTWMPHFWTFVYSTRYWVILIFIIQLAVFVLISNHDFTGWKQKVTKALIYISIVYGVIFFSFSAYQFYSPNGNGAGSVWENEKENIEMYNYINSIAESNFKSKELILISNNEREDILSYSSAVFSKLTINDILDSGIKLNPNQVLMVKMKNNLKPIDFMKMGKLLNKKQFVKNTIYLIEA
tara:strand:- start:11359 stop:12972 length:1614 start_codon:yes stop_codon:yes gene_type:complete